MKMRRRQESGFTLIEVMIAAAIMIILCIGTLTVFEHAVKINTGNNLRSQAESVLQAEVEYYRSLKFVPGSPGVGDPLRSTDLIGSPTPGNTINRPQRTSSDGQVFNITATVTNLQYAPGGNDEIHVTYKQITVNAVPASAPSSRPGWVSDTNLHTSITFQRVRTN